MINNINDVGYIAWITPNGFDTSIYDGEALWSPDAIYSTPEEILKIAQIEYQLSNESSPKPQDLVIWKVQVISSEQLNVPMSIKFIEPVVLLKLK